MDTSTLSVAEATQTAAAAQMYRNLSIDPKRMAVIKVWDAIMRGARQYCEAQGFVTVYNMLLGQTDIRKYMPFLINHDSVI